MEEISKKFAPYEISIKLEEKGFDGLCIGYYRKHNQQLLFNERGFRTFSSDTYTIDAPLWQDVVDWFREKYNTHIYIAPLIIETAGKSGHRYSFSVDNFNNNKECSDETPLGYLTYYEALNKAIEVSFKLI